MFFISSQAWNKEQILYPHEESNLRPSDSALQCSISEPLSEVYYEVHMTRVLHTTRINNVDSVMFVDSLSHVRDKMKNIFLFFFTELKTYHLSYFYLMIYSYHLL